MNIMLSDSQILRLNSEKNIWLASVRQNGRPHLVPVWFVWDHEYIFICIAKDSVKGRNIAENPYVCLSLEDGSNVLICEGYSQVVDTPWPNAVREKFSVKYEWDIVEDLEYEILLRIRPNKWLQW